MSSTVHHSPALVTRWHVLGEDVEDAVIRGLSAVMAVTSSTAASLIRNSSTAETTMNAWISRGNVMGPETAQMDQMNILSVVSSYRL